MSAPVKVQCPHCRAGLKLKDSSRLGNKLRCPKCETPFIAKAVKGRPQSSPKPKPARKPQPVDEDDYGFEAPAPRRRSGTRSAQAAAEKEQARAEKAYKKQKRKAANAEIDAERAEAGAAWRWKLISTSLIVWFVGYTIAASEYAEAVDAPQNAAVAGESNNEGEYKSRRQRRMETLMTGIKYIPKFPQVVAYTVKNNQLALIIPLVVQIGIVIYYLWLRMQEKSFYDD